MNVLVIHNSYQQPGGEDVVVAQESKLLKRYGHNVTTYQRSNHEIDSLSFGQRLGLIGRIVSAQDSRTAVRSILQNLKPDLVHIHNTFAMVSPSVYEACYQEGVPVVQTLHNYRLLCPAATFYRKTGPCEECLTHGVLQSVRHGCYRDSRLMSGAIALMLRTHRARQTWNEKIGAYIAISDFVRDKFIEAGFTAEKITAKPNFVDPDPGERDGPGDYALFLGRLSPEKGLSTLLKAWERLPFAVPLVIAGDGPMRQYLEDEVARRGLRSIRFVDRLKREEAFGAIKKAMFLVAPSIWSEPFGMVVAEAFACGTPVLGAFAGSIREMIDDGITGLHFAPGDAESLAEKVDWAWRHSSELAVMGKSARKVYEDRYTAERNYGLLMSIYGSAIESHARLKQNQPHRSAA
jgi:glycosyltransferase involved in cell wall biosynthesis